MKINNIIKKKKLLFVFGIILFLIIQINFINAEQTSGVSYCCEKTVNGVHRRNSQKEQCDSNFKMSPTSCESTSYCQKGCCYDSKEGICMENVPEEACKAGNGAWEEKACSTSPQCNLGCCVMGQQAAFTTLIRCKKLSAYYGIQTDFRKGVKNEIDCIALAGAEDIGACVYESEFQTTCKFTTRAECETSKKKVLNSTIGFHKDYLCTAKELGTICQPTRKTTCLENKDGVYYLDSCGNPANIYDASMDYESKKGESKVIDYWTNVKKPQDSCNSGKGNGNSKTCGNCDYLGGGICSDVSRAGTKPTYGDYICKDVNCYDTSNGRDYKNGESWCFWDGKNPENDNVGSRSFRHICMMGEETVEPCDDYRNKVCKESSISTDSGEFSQAGCVINKWQDCILAKTREDCANSDLRDCEWISMEEDIKKAAEAQLKGAIYGVEVDEKGKCVPIISPGLKFWDASSESHCAVANDQCVVKFVKKIGQKKTCVENCSCCVDEAGCDDKEAQKKRLEVINYCNSLGDCGPKSNYIGNYVNKGYKISIKKDGEGNVEEQGVQTGQGGSAQPSSSSTQGSNVWSSTNALSDGQTFTGNQGEQIFGGSAEANAASKTTGSVIQGFIIKTYNKITSGESKSL